MDNKDTYRERRCRVWIVELEKGVWLTSFLGDPGRTLNKEEATDFLNNETAEKVLKKARKFRPFKNAKIIELKGGE